MSGPFAFREARWTPDQIRRFWAYIGTTPHIERAYFSSHSGGSLLAFVERYLPLKGRRVLDYGCGPGFLLERLLMRGVRGQGLEFSAESVERARKRLEAHDLFGGVVFAEALPSPIGTGSVDVVFLIEVLEHLPAAQIDAVLQDIRRILRGGGFLVATTPHNEDIESAKTVCPDCGCVFHPWQHVGSFTPSSLTRLLDRAGMEARMCKATNFSSSRLGKISRLARRVVRGSRAAADEPHLVYIGARRG